MNLKVLPYTLLTLVVIFGGILFFFYAQSLWQPQKHVVTIAVSKTPLSTPFYVAKKIHAFEDTCVKVNMKEVNGGQRAFTEVMRGEADFGTSSDSVIAFQSLAKKAFVTHTMFVQSDNDVKLISRSSTQINSPVDLKGKNIGVIPGTASEFFLSTLLALEGLTTRDVVLHNFKPEELVNGFINDQVDAFVPWEPYGFNSVQLLSDEINIHDTKSLNTLSFNLISAPADTAMVEKAKCIIQGLSRAIDYIASNPSESKKIVMDELKLSSDFIEWVWPDYIFKLGLNQSLVLSIKSQAVWAIATQMSQFEEVPHAEHFIDTRALLQVMPNAVNIPQ